MTFSQPSFMVELWTSFRTYLGAPKSRARGEEHYISKMSHVQAPGGVQPTSTGKCRAWLKGETTTTWSKESGSHTFSFEIKSWKNS